MPDDNILSELQTNRLSDRSAPQIPIIVVGHPPQRRLQAGGWYSRGFTATAGILTALVLFGAASIFLLAGGTSYLIHRSVSANSDLTDYARRMAKPELAKKGVVAVADDASAFAHEGDIVFAGKGRDSKGKLCDFSVRWRVASFNGVRSWEWVSINVNGDESRYK